MASPIPDQIGRFRIEGVLGRGAMGIIYRAHDPAIDRKVAIKLVRADLLDGDERADYIERFQREAQAAGRCAHPNIVAIYDFALHEGNPYLAMEYIDGVTLQHLGQRPGGFTPAETVSLGGQILDGLDAAHALGVVHRDIKPANIMLTAQGRVKVTDFGISRLDTSNLTGPGGIVGTPSYMSPEQCRGAATDARSDLFSTGIVLYELLTGTKPFTGTSQHEVWNKLLHEDPPDSAVLNPDAAPNIHATIRCALSKNPGDRFQSAAAMAASLRAERTAPTDALRELARDADRTVLHTGAAPPSLVGLDPVLLTTIERRLAHHVGPIAGHLVRSAVKKADTIDKLFDVLMTNVPQGVERDRFREEWQLELSASLVRSGIGSTRQHAAAASLPEAELARAQAELARHLGPMARILVKRAAPGCSSVEQLWQRLAEHVEAADRSAFLAARTAGNRTS